MPELGGARWVLTVNKVLPTLVPFASCTCISLHAWNIRFVTRALPR